MLRGEGISILTVNLKDMAYKEKGAGYEIDDSICFHVDLRRG